MSRSYALMMLRRLELNPTGRPTMPTTAPCGGYRATCSGLNGIAPRNRRSFDGEVNTYVSRGMRAHLTGGFRWADGRQSRKISSAPGVGPSFSFNPATYDRSM